MSQYTSRLRAPGCLIRIDCSCSEIPTLISAAAQVIHTDNLYSAWTPEPPVSRLREVTMTTSRTADRQNWAKPSLSLGLGIQYKKEKTLCLGSLLSAERRSSDNIESWAFVVVFQGDVY